MKLEHLIIAKESSIDFEKNTLSVFDVIEDLTIDSPMERVGFPVQAIAVIKREDEKGRIEGVADLNVISPNFERLVHQKIKFVQEQEHRRTRMRINIMLPIDRTGVYTFQINGQGFSGEIDIGVKFNKITVV